MEHSHSSLSLGYWAAAWRSQANCDTGWRDGSRLWLFSLSGKRQNGGLARV